MKPTSAFCVALAFLAVSSAAPAAWADLPMTGAYVPQLQAVDTLMQNFMAGAGSVIPGGTIAITHAGKVIYDRGIGFSDAARSLPMQETALMRLASVSKPVTASAIQQLVKDGSLDLNAKVFNIGGNGGILNITPYNGVLGDPRLADITVNELLGHEGGWNRDTAGDLAFQDIAIANAMGLTSPPGIANTARYILSQPLQFTPGTAYNYSNIGYMFLGMVVESVSGQPYQSYLDNKILPMAGIPAWEITPGRTFAADQNPREPFYSTPYMARNVFNPNGPLVSWPYGGWDQDRFMAFGGLIGSAKAMAVLAESRIASGPEIGKLRSDYTTYSSYWWYHTGSLDGTDTLMLQASWGDWTYSILFDRRPTNGSSYTDSLVTPMQNILGGLSAWPAALNYAGDLTNDQWLTADDIALFKGALSLGSKSAFDAQHPGSRYLAGDFDGNGVVNGADLSGFIAALQHAGVPAQYIAQAPVFGDANLDGRTDDNDLNVLLSNWGCGATWDKGDFKNTGVVDDNDLNALLTHWTGYGTAVPEPAALTLLAFGAVAIFRRR